MTIDQLIERNNELRQGLNDENEAFYTDFMIYARTTNWFKDNQAIEEQLLAILQDILQAQKNGQSAADYFGADPKRVADSLLKNLPVKVSSFFNLIFYVFFGYFAIAFIPAISVPGKVIDLGDYMLAGIYLTASGFLATWLMGEAIYLFKRNPMKKWLKYLCTFLVALALLFPALAINIWIKTPLRLSFDGWVGIAAIVIMLIILAIYQKISVTSQVINRPIYYYIVFQAVVGIVTRLPFLEGVIATKNGKFVLAGLLGFGLVIFWFVSWRMLKKIKNDDEK